MNYLFGLVVRYVSRKKFRSASVIIAITLSVALFVALDISTKIAMISTLSAYTDYVGDFDILVYKENLYPFGSGNVSVIGNIAGVSVSAGRLVFGAKIVTSNNSSVSIIVVGINESWEKGLGSLDTTKGQGSLGGNTCLILETLGLLIGKYPGDNITLFYDLGGVILNYTLEISGWVRQKGKLPSEMVNVIFIDLETAWAMLNTSGIVNMVFVKIDQGLIDPQNPDVSIRNILDIAESIQLEIGFDFVVDPIKASVLSSVKEGLFFQRVFLQAFASITMIMALVLVVMISLMNMYDRLREIGILRSIGASRKRIFFIYISENLLLGILGGSFGVLAGYFIYQWMKSMFIPEILQKYATVIVMPIDSMLSGFLMGVGISVLGGLYPSIKASSLSPIEALQPAARRIKYLEEIEKRISPEAPDLRPVLAGLGLFASVSLFVFLIPYIALLDNPGIVFLVIFAFVIIILVSIIGVFIGFMPKLVSLVSAFLGFIASTMSAIVRGNLIRHKQRTIAIFFMLALSVASLFTISFIINTQIESSKLSVKLDAGAPIVVNAQDGMPRNVSEVLDSIEGIKSYCLVTDYYWVEIGDIVMWKSTWVRLYGVEPRKYYDSSYAKEFGLDRELVEGLNKKNTILISRGLAEYLGIQKGDDVRVERYGTKKKLEVVGVADKAPGFRFSVFKVRGPWSDVLVSMETLEGIVGQYTIKRIFIGVENEGNIDYIVQQLNKKLGERYNVQVVSINDYLERMEQGLKALEAILENLLLFAISVALLGEILSVLTAIRERLWEIGVLRAIGASRLQIATMFALEVLYISIIGYVSGLVSAYIVAFQLAYLTNYLSEMPVFVAISYDLLRDILIIVTFPPTITALLVAYRYSGKNIAEVLSKAERV